MSTTLTRVLRSLARSPGFAIVATVSMAVALGISTTVFAVMDATLSPEPPFRDVERLYSIGFIVRVQTPLPMSVLQAEVRKLDGIERTATLRYASNFVYLGDSYVSTLVASVDTALFGLLDARTKLGRGLTPADNAAGDVAVVTDQIWRRDFGNRPEIGTATIQVEGRTYRVVGVLPRASYESIQADVFVPMTEPGGDNFTVVRLKAGVTREDFFRRIKSLNERLSAAYGGPKGGSVATHLRSLAPNPLELRDFHRAMFGAAICILLIACANVAALMLARGLAQRRVYALRLALGASPAQIGREVVAEVSAVAVAGSVAGVIVTAWFVSLIRGAMPEEVQWIGFVEPQWSWRVLVAGIGAVVLSIAIAGGFPAWSASRTDPATPLKEGASSTTGRVHTRFRWLVVAELAIAMTILMSSSLMLKSVRGMRRFDFGYPVDQLLVAAIGVSFREDSTSAEDAAARQQEVLNALFAVPGVRSVAPGNVLSCYSRGVITSDLTEAGGPFVAIDPNGFRSSGCSRVGPRFFTTIGIPVIDGRDFEDGDLTGAGGAIIDAKTAKKLFPGRRAVGHLVKFGSARSDAAWLPVVGVVRDHRLGFDPYPEMGVDSFAVAYQVGGQRSGHAYVNGRWRDFPARSMSFVIRVDGNADSVRFAVQKALAPFTPTRGRLGVSPWNASFIASLRSTQFLALVFELLGLASLVLGAAGLFSVISYVVGQRMREFAVRISLGASPLHVIRLVLREALIMAIGGTAIGAGFGMWAAFLLWNLMVGVYPVDAQALIVAEVVLMATTMAACVMPALRAARSNPLDVIRAS